jgi:hypothetical protein
MVHLMFSGGSSRTTSSKGRSAFVGTNRGRFFFLVPFLDNRAVIRFIPGDSTFLTTTGIHQALPAAACSMLVSHVFSVIGP